MAINLDTTLRNNMLDEIATRAGSNALLRLRTGAKPANAAASRSGTILVAIDLGTGYLAAASGGSVALAGTETGTSEVGPSYPQTIGHWEIVTSGGTCVAQGTINTEWLSVDTTTITASGQTVNVTSGTFTAGNA